MLSDYIAEYDNLLLGKKTDLFSMIFQKDKPVENSHIAGDIIRYAVEHYLHWTPQEMADLMTPEILQQLKLDKIIRYLVCPPEIDPRRDLEDLRCLAWVVYPKAITVSTVDLTIRMLHRRMNREIYKWPKEFFSGPEGENRAIICLRYAIDNGLPCDSVQELYEAFAGKRGLDLMRRYEILTVCRDCFESPLDYLHITLSRSQHNATLYHFYKYLYLEKNAFGADELTDVIISSPSYAEKKSLSRFRDYTYAEEKRFTPDELKGVIVQ